jgi:hypothetical protein
VRARFAWLAGAVGVAGAVAYRRLRRAPSPAEDPRAAELRQKLDESRGIVEEREEFDAAETPVDAAEETGLEERRRAVHERGRGTAEQMRRRPVD